MLVLTALAAEPRLRNLSANQHISSECLADRIQIRYMSVCGGAGVFLQKIN